MRYVLVPGAGGTAWFWHRVTPLLEAAGHEAIAVDLPGDDPTAGLDAYCELVVTAIAGRADTVLVGQSLGGFTVAMAAARVPIARLALVNAMIPNPGETAGAWWGNVGQDAARIEAAKRGGYSAEFDLHTYFLHDVPEAIAEAGAPYQREEAEIVFGSPCRFERWPAIPIHAIGGAGDRFFPIDFQRRIARERLGLELEVVPGGHLAALSHPRELVDRLLAG
jgi:pimeloyl-ACP methyl ester carboxylesterase